MTQASAGARSSNFPVALKLQHRRCLVVGGASEAAARARALLAAGANVALVHPSPAREAEALRDEFAERVSVEAREYRASDLDGTWLAVLTDRDAALARRMSQECEARQLFFCAVDQPPYNTFAHLALARAGDLVVAISTGGRAPALARRLRELLQELFDASGLPAYVERLAELRERTPSVDRAKTLGEAVRGLRLEGRLVVPDEPR